MMKKKKETPEEIETRVNAEEAGGISPEEAVIIKAARASLSKAENSCLTDMDAMLTTRGYSTYEPRQEETNKAFKMIASWRTENNYHDFVKANLPKTTQFHQHWEERVFGVDKHGHILIGFRVSQIRTDNLNADYAQEEIGQLVAQKLAAWRWYKQHLSSKSGVQRYKHTFLIDFKGGGSSVLRGKSRNMIKHCIDVAADQFPDCLYKMYIVNTPLMMRAGWSMVKPWLHPVTVSRINICSTPKDCVQKMMELDGFTLEGLPTFLGGDSDGASAYDVLQDAIEDGGGAQLEAEQSRRVSVDIAGGVGDVSVGGTVVWDEAAGNPDPFSPTPLGTML
eukprot:gene5904-18729_t